MQDPTSQGGWERPDAPLGTLIFRAGLLSEEKLQAALEEGEKSGRRLGEILVQKGWLEEKDLARLLAGQRGLSFVSLRGRGFDPEVARLLPERVCRMYNAMPIEARENGEVVVAVADPTDDAVVAGLREALARGVRLVVTTKSEITSAIDEVFKSRSIGTEDEAPARPVVAPPDAAVNGRPDDERPAAPEQSTPSETPTPGPRIEIRVGDPPQADPFPEPLPEPLPAAPAPVHSLRADPAPPPARLGGEAPEQEQPYRVLLNLESGEPVEVALHDEKSDAETAARELVTQLVRGVEWPSVEGRFYNPAKIVSVEIVQRERWLGASSRARWGAGVRPTEPVEEPEETPPAIGPLL